VIGLQPGRRVIGVVLGAGAFVFALACVWLGLAAKAFSDLFLSNGWVLLLTGIVFGGLAAAMGVLLIVRSRTDPGSVAIRNDEIRIAVRASSAGPGRSRGVTSGLSRSAPRSRADMRRTRSRLRPSGR
jgi:hypothetical protein